MFLKRKEENKRRPLIFDEKLEEVISIYREADLVIFNNYKPTAPTNGARIGTKKQETKKYL